MDRDNLEINTPVMLRTTMIEPNRDQPRKTFNEDSLAELADSISRLGILQPLAVEQADGYYKIVAGERRWRAAMRLHLKEVPAIILNLDEKGLAEASIVENLQREDLNPIEKAAAYRDYCNKFHVTQEELATRISKKRASITNTMRLLTLPEPVQDMIRDGEISAGHGVALTLTKDKALQEELAHRIVRDQLSVREVEKILKKTRKAAAPAKSANFDAEWLSSTMTKQTGWKIDVSAKEGKGCVHIHYYDDATLDDIYEYLMSRHH